MKALVLEEPGERPHLEVKEVPRPTPGPHDVLVKVKACGLCYHDVLVMRGILRRGVKPKVILGHEISGEVVEIGKEVSTFSVGDRVVSILTQACGNCSRCLNGREHRCLNGIGVGHAGDGGFAEYVKISEHSLVALPKRINLEKACILACPIGVGYHSLKAAELQGGETVLITGAGGGLGVHLVQLAAALGASQVFAVSTSPGKEERLRELGATEVILAQEELDFSEVATALTGDQGVDVVVNTVGSSMFDSCFRSLAPYGRMALVGEITGREASVSPAEMIFRDIHLIGVSGVSRQQVREAARLAARGKVKAIISETFPLDRATEAYQKMLERKTFGRVALVP